MQRATPQDLDVVAVGVGQSEGGWIHEAMFVGCRFFPAVKNCRIDTEDVSFYLNEGNGLCAYHALEQGAPHSYSPIASPSLDVRQVKKSMLSSCFSWVTGARHEALAELCDRLNPDEPLTSKQVAS